MSTNRLHASEVDPENVTVSVHHPTSDVIVARVRGELDLATCGWLQRRLGVEVEHRPRLLFVDLTEVGFFGARALHTLLDLRTGAAHRGVEVRLVGSDNTWVARPFALLGLADLLQPALAIAGRPHDRV